MPPKDPDLNRFYRAHLLAFCDTPARQQAVLQHCREDFIFWLDAFAYQYNPAKLDDEVGPFLAWGFQEEALRQTVRRLFGQRKDALWEKSRELGATWMALLIFVWMCLFHERKKFLCVSHTAAAVDVAEDPDSLFWKISFILEYLPDWMRRGARKGRAMVFHFPATRSTITGAASTGRAGVGGRATAVFLDELGKMEVADKILGQTRDTGPRLMVSTHFGTSTAFYRKTVQPDVWKIYMHWSQHPAKNQGLYRYNPKTKSVDFLDPDYEHPPGYNFVLDGSPTGGPYPGLRSPWYDEECRERGNPRDVAMHLDIDPEGSASQAFNRVQIIQLVEQFAEELPPLWQGRVDYDPETAQPRGLVAVRGGPLKLWCQLDGYGKPPRAPYAFGADCATGTGATSSCLSAMNAQTGEKLVEFTDPHVEPKDFAFVLVALGRLFQNPEGENAWLAWECPGPGQTVSKWVLALGYGNIYYSRDEDTAFAKATRKPGWWNTPKSAYTLLKDYEQALYARKFINHSKDALLECLKFEYVVGGAIKHGKEDSKDDPSGARVNHGDHVIADALAWKMAKVMGYGDAKPTPAAPATIPINSVAGRRLLSEPRKRSWA